MVITPAVLGRRLSLSPVVILLWLLLWTWMWDIVGAFLAVPMLAVIKIFCDRFETLRPLSDAKSSHVRQVLRDPRGLRASARG